MLFDFKRSKFLFYFILIYFDYSRVVSFFGTVPVRYVFIKRGYKNDKEIRMEFVTYIVHSCLNCQNTIVIYICFFVFLSSFITRSTCVSFFVFFLLFEMFFSFILRMCNLLVHLRNIHFFLSPIHYHHQTVLQCDGKAASSSSLSSSTIGIIGNSLLSLFKVSMFIR